MTRLLHGDPRASAIRDDRQSPAHHGDDLKPKLASGSPRGARLSRNRSRQFNPGLQRVSKHALSNSLDPVVETLLKLIFRRQVEILVECRVFLQRALLTSSSLARSRFHARGGCSHSSFVFPNHFIGRPNFSLDSQEFTGQLASAIFNVGDRSCGNRLSALLGTNVLGRPVFLELLQRLSNALMFPGKSCQAFVRRFAFQRW